MGHGRIDEGTEEARRRKEGDDGRIERRVGGGD
jgi:hypothetical protein